ncbi:MAG TPA: PilN domain-containing protein [Nitrospirota bacterium]|nr:PilN domain-containing protein [Nitrospirota bacterium]
MISVNFASRNYVLTNRIGSTLAAIIAVLLVLAASLLWRSWSLRQDIRAMEVKLHNAEAADEQARSALVERERLVKDLNSMSAFIASRRFSWTGMFSQLEAAVPTGVALKNVVFSPKDRTLSLEGAAQSPEALRNLIVGLERSKAFADAHLNHQTLEKGTIVFHVVAVYHERHPAAGHLPQ